MTKVFIDPGHGGIDPGAIDEAAGFIERDMNLIEAQACGKELERHGIQVTYSRTDNTTSNTKKEAAQRANKSGADLMLSIHNNHGGGDGFEGMYRPSYDTKQAKEKLLLEYIAKHVLYDVGQNLREDYIYSKKLAALNNNIPVSVLVEGVYIDNSTDREIVKEITGLEKFGIAYAHGILEYLSIAILPSGESTASSNNLSTPPAESNEKGFQPYLAKTVGFPETDFLNCRKQPNADAEAIETYWLGEQITILGLNDTKTWGKVATKQDGSEGWVYLKYVELIETITITQGVIEIIATSKEEILEKDEETGDISVNNQVVQELLDEREKNDPESKQQVSNTILINTMYTVYQNCKNNEDLIDIFKQQVQFLLKKEIKNKKMLEGRAKIIVKTAPNSFTDISKEMIMEKLGSENGPQDIVNYYKQSYNDQGWNKQVEESPESLIFWFDFMNTDGEMGKYSAAAIGHRPKAVKDDKIKAIYFQSVPNVLFVEEGTELSDKDYFNSSGYTFIYIPKFLENYFTISAQGQSANDKLYSLLNQHINMSESVTLTSVPIYHLQPNNRIMVKDDNTKTNGEYIVNKVTIPLTYNGTSSISTVKVVDKLY